MTCNMVGMPNEVINLRNLWDQGLIFNICGGTEHEEIQASLIVILLDSQQREN